MRLLLGALFSALLVLVPSSPAHGKPARPTVSSPPDGVHGYPLWDSWHRLGPFGYTQEEFFISGRARAASGKRARYTTRVIVFRPKKQRDFNGTVVLDWVNVTAQFENAVDSLEARELLLRDGYAFVHVSAQKAGLCCLPGLTPKTWDPVRYAKIHHPGDAYAANMFAQVARAIRGHGKGPKPMRGLRVKRVLAAGQSQSAHRLYTFVNRHPRGAGVIDGLLIHGGGEKTFRRRLRVPVIHLLSDREADPAKPTADPRYRLWEVAGTAHSDYFIGYQQVFGAAMRVAGLPAQDHAGYRATMKAAGNYGQLISPLHPACIVAGAAMPMHYAVNSALHQLDRWVRTGKAPRRMPRYQFRGGALRTDDLGHARGGIRLPPVAAPVARYLSNACELGGMTVPMTDVELLARYGTFARYRRLMARATDRAVRHGWLLPADARDQMRRVCRARVRFLLADGATATCPRYRPPRYRMYR